MRSILLALGLVLLSLSVYAQIDQRKVMGFRRTPGVLLYRGTYEYERQTYSKIETITAGNNRGTVHIKSLTVEGPDDGIWLTLERPVSHTFNFTKDIIYEVEEFYVGAKWTAPRYPPRCCPRDLYASVLFQIEYKTRLPLPVAAGGSDLGNICGTEPFQVRVPYGHALGSGNQYVWEVSQNIGGPWSEIKRTDNTTATINASDVAVALGLSSALGRTLHLRVNASFNGSDHASGPTLLRFLKGAPATANLSATGPGCIVSYDGSISVSNMKFSDGSSYSGSPSQVYTFTGPLGIPQQYQTNATSFTVDNSVNTKEGMPFLITPGTWNVMIESNGSCSNTFIVDVPNAVPVSFNSAAMLNPITCQGGADGSIQVKVNDGQDPFLYELYDNSSFSGSPVVSESVSARNHTFTGLSADRYYARITDNCSNQAHDNTGVLLSDPANPITMQSITATDIICPDNANAGSVTASVTGGTANFTYQLFRSDNTPVDAWSGSSRTYTFSGLSTNSYYVEIEDINGCMVRSATVTVQTGSPINGSVTATDIQCHRVNDGRIVISASGGSGSYEYSINGGATYSDTPTFSGLSPGSYTPRVRDKVDAACTWTGAGVTLTQPSSGLIVSSFTETSSIQCFGDANGQLHAEASGGTNSGGGYTFDLRRNGTFAGSETGNPVNFSGLTSGSYEVTVTDDNGCTTIGDIILAQPAPVGFGTVTPAIYTGGFNVSCTGASDGEISVSSTGGVYPHQIIIGAQTQIQNSASETVVFTGLSAGTYSITVEDNNNCTTAISATLTEPPLMTVADESSTDVICPDNPITGTATITVSNGIQPFTYRLFKTDNTLITTFSTADRTYTFNGMAAGNYYMEAEDVNGCLVATADVVVGAGSSVTATVTPSHVDCRGNSTGSIDIAASGGSGSYEYSIDGGVTYSNNRLFEGLLAGAYNPVVKDLNDGNCIYVGAQVDITEPAADLVINSISETASILCYGDAAAQISVSAIGGTPPATGYSYTLRNGATVVDTRQGMTVDFPNLPAGVYEVTVTDENNCTAVAGITLTEPELVTYTDLSRKLYSGGWHVSCQGASDGEVTVATDGGIFPHSVTLGAQTQLINTSGEQVVFTGLTAGTYTITVQDANNCTHPVAVILSEPDGISFTEKNLLNYIGGFNVSCHGESDGELTVGTSGGTYPHEVSIAGQLLTLNSASETVSATGLSAQTYTVQIEDANGCIYSEEVSLTSPDPLEFSDVRIDELFGGHHLACNGDTDGEVSILTAGGVFPHQITVEGVTETVVAPTDDALFTDLSAGTYTALMTDANGCTLSTSFTITEPELISLDEVVVTEPACYSENTGSLKLEATGGIPISGTHYRYIIEHLNVPDGLPFEFPTIQEQEALVALFENLIAGDYALTVYDHFGCMYTDIIPVYTSSQLDMEVTTTPVTCKGDTDGTTTFTVSGGVGPYIVEYQNNFRQNIGSVVLSEGTPVTLSGFEEEFYYLRITDATGCGFYNPNYTFHVAGPAAPLELEAIVTDVSCKDDGNGSVLLQAVGGWQFMPYKYGTDASNLSIGNNYFSNLVPGVYTYYARDARGCLTSLDVTISEPEELTSSVESTVDVACFGDATGRIVLSVAGGTPPYEASLDGGITYTSALIIEGLTANSYSINIRDANNCTTFESADILEPTALNLAIDNITEAYCGHASGSVTASVTGGVLPYSYQWKNATDGVISTDLSLTSIPAGDYELMVTDANECVVSASVLVEDMNSLSSSLTDVTNVSCEGANDGRAIVQIHQAASPYTVVWSTGQTGREATNLTPGIHSVTVVDANNCEETHTFEITSPVALTHAVTSIDPLCFGDCNGSIEIAASGGTTPYTYSWSVNNSNSNTINGLCDGTYTVTVTDSNGCTTSGTIVLTEPAQQKIAIDDEIRICPGQNIEVDAGSFAQYTWSSTSGFSSTARKVMLNAASTYTVKVADEKGCTARKEFKIIVSDNALQANFLLPEEAYVGDTVVCIDISFPVPGSIKWLYDHSGIVDVGVHDEYQELVFIRPGQYTIGMAATLGDCQSTQYKQITISGGDGTGSSAGRKSSLIQEFTIHPNPTDGEFEVSLELAEVATAVIMITDINGVMVHKQLVEGNDNYRLQYNLTSYRSGIYNVVLIAGSQRETKRILIN